MSNNQPFDQSELIRLALASLDTQIAELQEKRAQLAAMANPPTTSVDVKAATPEQKSGKMSDEARAKISAAATARWAKIRKAKAADAKSAPTAKRAPARKKARKAPAKKSKPEPVTSAENS